MIKSILREYNIRPSKRLGQSFLIDQNIQRKIIDAAQICKEDIVLEIGPGLGALTQDLCERAKKVLAIEKDRRLCRFLKENSRFDNLELIQGDILKYTLSPEGRGQGEGVKVIGNLPYYISSPTIIKLIENRKSISSIFVTVQKEFAERLVAKPDSKIYGAISCFVQFYTVSRILFSIKKSAFYPVPAVDSCFLKLHIRETPLYLTDEQKLFRIIRKCFEKRRKTILNSLYSSGEFRSKEEALDKLRIVGINPIRRPETISLEEFVNLVK